MVHRLGRGSQGPTLAHKTIRYWWILRNRESFSSAVYLQESLLRPSGHVSYSWSYQWPLSNSVNAKPNQKLYIWKWDLLEGWEWTKVGRREEGMKVRVIRMPYIYTWNCHKNDFSHSSEDTKSKTRASEIQWMCVHSHTLSWGFGRDCFLNSENKSEFRMGFLHFQRQKKKRISKERKREKRKQTYRDQGFSLAFSYASSMDIVLQG